MKNVIGLSILLTLSLCLGCYDDKGNYDYHEFNEITIGDRGFDTAYILTSFVDTLRISPEIDFKLAENTHLKFEWVARSNGVDFTEYPLGNGRDLVFPVSLPTETYTLYFKVTDTLNTQIRTFIIICACLIAVLTIGLAMAVMQITTGMLRPIQVLAQAAGRISEGDLDARADVDSRDEIAVLADRFNDMAGNIQTLVVKVREDEQKMRKADLRLLQEQINPHFLYNTLDNIVWLIEGNEPDEAVEMVVTLSEFFRLVLSKGKEFITIRQEEQHISSYLQIQGKRYHDILDYHIYIDPEIYEYQIPKLTLQPLVENALYHGIKYKRSRGMIEITGTKEGENLYLTVADDGVGMDEDELKKLKKEISRPCKETESGFGLANVNERIRMYFGSEYGMKIWSEKGSGTRITIEIPAITDNPEKPEAVKQSIRSEEAENEAKK